MDSKCIAWKQMILLGIFLFVLCSFLANLEIQIEGPNGWAAELPTWRVTSPSVTWVFGGKPITGYHTFLNLLLLTFFHFPLLFVRFSVRTESKILFSYFAIAVVWDFLWFAFNPHFGMTQYGPETVWWFKNWFLGVPVDYFVGLGVSLLVWLLPVFFRQEPLVKRLAEWGLSIGSLLALSATTAAMIYLVNAA